MASSTPIGSTIRKDLESLTKLTSRRQIKAPFSDFQKEKERAERYESRKPEAAATAGELRWKRKK